MGDDLLPIPAGDDNSDLLPIPEEGDDQLAAEKATLVTANTAKEKIKKSDPNGDRAPGSRGLTPEEEQAVAADDARLAGVDAANKHAEAESAVPTALKLPLMAAKGAAKAIDSTAALAGIHTGGSDDLSHEEDVGGAAGKITEGLTQFTVGMIGAGKFIKGAKLVANGARALQGVVGIGEATGTAAKIGAGLGKGAIADATVFDHEERLSNLIEEYPSLSTPISRYLAADPNDSMAEDRLKSVLEGAVLGGAMETVLAGIRGAKKVILAGRTGGKEAAEKAAVEAADELEVIQSKGTVSNVRPLPGNKLTPNIKPLEQDIKEYAAERLMKGSEFDPGYSRDLNIAKQSTTDGAKQVINLMSDAFAPEIDKLKGGVQTFEKIKALAAIAGEEPNALMARMSSRAVDAKRMASDVVATEEWLLSMARSASEEARRLDNGISKDPALLNQMMDAMGSVLGDLKAVKTSAARTTGAGRIIKGDIHSMEQVKALIAAGGDLEKVAAVVKKPTALKRGVAAYTEYWVNSILSGPKTHVVNITTNLLNTIARPIEKVAGGSFREGLHEALGLVKSVKDSIAMAARAGYLEESILDPHMLKTDTPRGAISAAAFGIEKKGILGAPLGTAIDWIGKAVRLPTRMLMTSDEFFKQLNYRSNVYAKAAKEGIDLGKEGAALAEHIESRFASAFDGTTKRGLDEGALHEARIATFTEDLLPGSFANTLQGISHKHPLARLILPFVRTPTNIVKQLGWRTPGVNLFMKSFKAELAAGGGRAAAARGKFVTGGLLWAGAGIAAMEGRITGKGPADPEERAALLATGWRPYSVKTDDGTYYEYGRLDPFGMVFGLAADFAEARGHMDDATAEETVLAMGMALASNLSSKTYLRGVTEALDAVSQPKDRFAKWWQSRVGSNVPSGAQQIAGLMGKGDDTMREVRTAMDAIYARTPGLSDKLPPKRNLLGEPIKYPPGMGPDSVSPFTYSKDLNDSVKTELARLSYGFRSPSEKINEGRIDLTKYKNDKGQDAYDRLMELRTIERKGRYTLKERLAHEIESERYQNLPEGNDKYQSKKLDRIRGILGEYHEATMKRLVREFRDLARDIKTDERNAKAVKRTGVDAIQALTQP